MPNIKEPFQAQELRRETPEKEIKLYMTLEPKLRNYLQSQSSQFGLVIGFIMYLSYAIGHQAWANPSLIALTSFISFFIPHYSKLSNLIEEKIQFKTAMVTPGRLARFCVQLAFNLFVFLTLKYSQVIQPERMSAVGGVIVVAIVTTAASQGIQYVGIGLANREYGEKNKNVLVSLSINIIITALATLGLGWSKTLFYFFGLVFGSIFLGIGITSDLRSYFSPKCGVGIFFGTFNPLHNSHLEIIRRAINDRGLNTLYLHSTVIPKLHQIALKKGEIKIAEWDSGMRVYELTKKADVHMNYFPTGNRFFEYKTRVQMMDLAVKEAGLADRVKVLSLPKIYESEGFYGIIRHIRKLHPNEPIHGIHGSDLGGMWIRGIYDESGHIYPYPVRRIDNISATAIRKGEKGMAPTAIEEILRHLRAGASEITINKTTFNVRNGELEHVTK